MPSFFAAGASHAESKPIVSKMPDERRSEVHAKLVEDANARAEESKH